MTMLHEDMQDLALALLCPQRFVLTSLRKVVATVMSGFTAG